MTEVMPIKKVNVGHETFKTLLTMIMNGTWPEGTKIPSENELKESFGVSRHTVRAAINNLSMLGILETRRGDGNYVRSTGIGLYMDFLIPYLCARRDDIQTLIEFRESIESTIARYAALRATPEDIARIKKQMDVCEQCADNLERFLEEDYEFHYAIALACKNELLIQCMYIIKVYYFPVLSHYFNFDIAHGGIECHKKIYEAIRSGDANAAMLSMNEHIRRIMTKIKVGIASADKEPVKE